LLKEKEGQFLLNSSNLFSRIFEMVSVADHNSAQIRTTQQSRLLCGKLGYNPNSNKSNLLQIRVFVCLFAVLSTKSRTSHMQEKCAATVLYPELWFRLYVSVEKIKSRTSVNWSILFRLLLLH
jgi:hypothetical protein